MTASELTKHWENCYGIPPLSHLLRIGCRDRWMRIYALPEGKRYPETEDEYEVMLTRHNTLLADLFVEGQDVLRITTGCSFGPEPIQEPLVADRNAWYWMTVRSDPDEPDSAYWHLHARTVPWGRGVFDSMLRHVADCRIVNVIVLGIAQCCAYAPYDGGADIVTSSRTCRDILRKRYDDWASPLPSGL